MGNFNIRQIAIGIGLLLAGVFLGWVLFRGYSEPVSHLNHQHDSIPEVWTCVMHTQIRSSGPGKCPICGMDLVPVTSSATDSLNINQIQMTEAALKLADIQTVTVGKSKPEKQVYLPGRIEADERSIANVTAHFSGRVEKLFAEFTGQHIRKGQKLATLYSPDLVTAQMELFEAIKFKSTNPSFYQAAVQKLKLWELTAGQIKDIEASGEVQYHFTVYAHRSGTIINKNVSEGGHVMDGQVMFEIADLTRLWVLFDVFESDLPWVKVGDSISFKVQSLPGQNFKSLVTFIDPVVNDLTRTASIRTELANVVSPLKPKMFVEGILDAGLALNIEVITIPKTAVLWTGKRAVVYVKLPGYSTPTFEFREISLGTDAGEFYVVNEGLAQGEKIVANGIFKVDAAAQLQGKLSMMNPAGSITSGRQQYLETISAGKNLESDKIYPIDVPPDFRRQLKSVYYAYLPLKEALISANETEAHLQAGYLLKSISRVDSNGLSVEAIGHWMKYRKTLTESVNSMLSESDVQGIRKVLSGLSEQLYHCLVKFQVETDGFRMYCPMAFGTGASWLSETDEIRNPYMSHEMLKCGDITEKLK